MRTIIGVLPTVASANYIAHQFELRGLPSNEINVVRAAADKSELKKVKRSDRTDSVAAREGALLGVGLGVLFAGILMAVPGVTPFMAGSILGTFIGSAIAGAVLVGAIVVLGNMGFSHEEAVLYEEAVRDHGVVLAAHVPEKKEYEFLEVLASHGAHDVQEARDLASMTSHEAFYQHPYPCDSTIRTRPEPVSQV